MKVFALGDPHLSFARPKPMDIFGPHWKKHPERMARAWDAVVDSDDVVLVAGDISWAHSPAEAAPDLEYLAARRGRLKLLLKGNHDSWWRSASQARRLLPDGLELLHGDARRLEEGLVLCGARGWNLPGMPWSDPEKDPPIFRRELLRLRRSLEAATRLRRPGDALLAMLHYPPLGPPGTEAAEGSEVLEALARAGTGLAVYGHLHGEDHRWAPRGERGGVELRFVAADFVDFTPQPVWERGRGFLLDGPPAASGSDPRPGTDRHRPPVGPPPRGPRG